MSTLNREACDALDRMDEIGTCWQAISDLIAPGLELQEPQRDNLAVLTCFLAREYELAREAFTRANQ